MVAITFDKFGGTNALDNNQYIYIILYIYNIYILVKDSFRKNPSLRQSLMFKKLPGSRGVFKCQNNCTLCSKNIFPGEFLTLKNGINLIPNARFECTSRNLVYVIVCRGCNEFYIGETGDMLKNRFTVHRQHMSLDYNDAPVKADPHLRTCGKGNYYVFRICF